MEFMNTFFGQNSLLSYFTKANSWVIHYYEENYRRTILNSYTGKNDRLILMEDQSVLAYFMP